MSKAFPRFQEYLNSRGKVLEKGKVCDTGDNLEDTPAPKAPEDPRKKNKSGGKQPQVKEYLSQQGKMVDKPKVAPVADYDGLDPKSPPGSDKPYRAPGQGTGSNKGETGFADIGDKRLVYTPDTKTGDSPHVPGGKSASGWENKTKTEQFIDQTKNMTFSEFTQHMLKEGGFEPDDDLPTVTSYSTGKFHPYPPEAIKYVVVLADKNDRVLENLIHGMKDRGMLSKLVKSLMDHNESFDSLNDLFEEDEEGPRRCHCLARSMNDRLAKFMREQDDLYESVGPPMAELEDEDEPIEPPEGDDEDLEGLEGDEEDEEDEEMGEEEPDEMGEEPPRRKLKKRFAHNNVLDAMSSFGPMRDAMKAY